MAVLSGIFVFLMLATAGSLQASHYAGGQITYTWLSGSNYRVTKTIYRDCAGITLGATSIVQISPTNVGSSMSLSRTQITDITPLCPGQVSRCQSFSGAFGIEEHIYSAIKTFNPLPANGTYRLSATLNARNAAITTISNPGSQNLYLETNLNPNFSSPGNSSPSFLNIPIAFLCAGQPATISPNAFDPNGDALQYSLTACRTNVSTVLPYGPGFSPTNPLTTASGLTIDNSTGLLSFTPTVAGQVAVICILAEEFRNGQKIGQIIRDIQVRVLNCNNASPNITPITNYFIQVGQQLCVNVSATDVDQDNITLSAVGGIIPPATFVQLTNNAGSATGQFCFTPTLANAGQTYTITINAVDDACPAPGSGSETFNITIPVPCNMEVEASGVNPTCGSPNGSASVSVVNGTAPFNYTWSGPNNYQSSVASPTGLIAGTYCVVVQDGNSCVDSSCVTITGSASPVSATATVVNANCGQANGSVTVSATGGSAPYLYSLNGGPAQSSNVFSGLGQGSYNILVTDNNGCTATASATVGQAQDVTPPAITCPANISVNNDPGQCGAAVSFAATATDDCSTPTVSQTGGPSSGSLFPVGTTTVTFTATDGASNTSNCSFTVTVADNEAPNAVCQNLNVFLSASGNASVTATQVDGGSTDNCGIASLSASPTSFSCSNLGANQVTLTVNDVNGNSSTCTATVTVVDTIAPTAICQNITLYLDANGQASVASNQINNGSSDNCGTITLTSVPPSVNCSNFGQTVHAFLTVTDASGNSSTCTANVSVEDTTAPTIVCPPGQNYECVAGVPAPDPTLVVATDNCLPLTYLFIGDVDNGGSGCPGDPKIVTRTYMVEDPTHNQSICTQTFTVVDNTPPVVSCPADVTLECGPGLDISPAALGSGWGSDNCGGTASSSSTCYGPLSLGVVDNAGNPIVDYCGQFGCFGQQGPWGSITMYQDSVNIVLNVQLNLDWRIANVSYQVGPESSFVPGAQQGPWDITSWTTVSYPQSANGTQTATITIPLANLDPCYAIGAVATGYKWDFFGGLLTASVRPLWMYDAGWQFRSNPTTTPYLLSHCTASCLQGAPATMTWVDNVVSGCGNTSVITRTWTASDDCGNSSSCDQVITIEDNTAPVITCPANITVSNDPGQCGAAVNFSATATDGCGNTTIAYSTAPGSFFSLGTSTVTATATDECNNSSSCTFTVTVADNEAPNAVCQNITVQLNANGSASITASDVDGGSTDNCGIASISAAPTSFSCSNVGANAVTLTVTDVNGNSSTCSASVTVEDNVAPNAVCQNVTVQLDANGAASITASDVDGGSTDNCGPVSISASPTSFNCSNVGGNSVTLTVTDANSNVSTCTATVTVEDNIAPNAVCQNITVQLDGNGQATITASDVDGGSTDNCAIASLSINDDSFDCSDIAGAAIASDLFISEYIEGSSNNKCIEIFNGTGAAVNLSGYELRFYFNGLSTPGSIIALSGTVADGDVWVVCDVGAAPQFLQFADQTSPANFYNGDDAVELRKNGNAIDIIGSIGEDPGSQWIVGGNHTMDHTLLRNGNVNAGNANGFPGFPSLGNEWTELPLNNVSNLGTHSLSSQNPGVTLTVTDASGNSSTCNATVTVQDNVAPNAVCQSVTVQLDANGAASIAASDVDGGSTDNCGIASLDVNPSTFGCSNVGGNSVTLTVTDVNGNVSTCSASVTVEDNVAPNAICQSIVVQLDGNGQATITASDIDNGSNDNCAVASISIDDNSFDCSDVATSSSIGDLFISEYIEGSGNNKCIEIYNGTGAAVNLSGYSLAFYFNGSSSAGTTIALSGTVANGDVWVVCDNDAAANFLAEADQVSTSNFFSGDDAVALIKNGNAIDIFGQIGVDPGAQWSVGGNTTQDETLVRNASVTAGNTANAAGFPSLGTEWSAGGTNSSSNLGSHFVSGGSPVVTLTVTDVNGNSSSCSATVTVEDNIAPDAVCQNITLNIGSTGSVTIVASDLNGGSSDNCGIASLAIDRSSFACADLGANTVTLTVTDVNGNVSTCTSTVTVTNDPLVVSVASPTFACGYNVSCNGASDGGVNSSTTGGCEPYSYNWSNGGTNANIGNLTAGTYSVTVTDANGATATATITLTEPDLLTIALSSPTYNGGWNISCNGESDGSINSVTAGGCQPYGYNWSNGSTSANPGNLSAGAYSVTVTDANGCTATASITLTEPPVLTAEAGSNVTVYYPYQNYNCTTLSGSHGGGTMPYSVSWSDGSNTIATTSSVQVCPTTSTVYYYTVVDANGCTVTDSVMVCVMDVTCDDRTNNGVGGSGQGGNGQNNGQGNGGGLVHISICHIPPGNPNNAMTKCIPEPAVASHLAHGDYLGACGSNTVACEFPTNGGSSKTAQEAGSVSVETDAAHYHLEAFPNPTNGALTVTLDCHECASDEVYQVKLVDMMGQVVDTKSMDFRSGVTKVDFDLSGYAQGFYMVVLNAGDLRITRKVMKN